MQTSVRGVVASSAVRARVLSVAAVGALLLSSFEMIRLHLVTIGKVDPLRDTLSGYAWIDPGKAPLEATVVWMSIGSLALFAALLAAGMNASPTTFLLFSMWVTGLALAALFPASRIGWTFSGKVHWLASLLAFLSLPVIGFLVAKPLAKLTGSDRVRRWVVRLSTLSTLALVIYGVTYLPSLLPDLPLAEFINTLPLAGLSQRVTLVMDVALLIMIGLVLLRLTSPRRDAEPPQRTLANY